MASEVGSDLPLFLVGGTVLGVGRGEQVYPLADLLATACVVVTPEAGVSTPKAFAEWDRLCGVGLCGAGTLARELPERDLSASRSETAELRSTGRPGAAVPTPTEPELRSDWKGEGSRRSTGSSKLTVSETSDRMSELGRGLSAWLSGLYSGAPSGFMERRGRAENPLLWLVRAGIENDFERVVFPEYPKLSEGKRALLRAGANYASLSGSGSTLYGLFGSRAAAARAANRLRRLGWAAQATTTLPRRAYWKRIVAD